MSAKFSECLLLYRNGSDGSWPLQDSIGSVVGKVNSSGSIVGRQSFGPFGEEASGNSASGNGKGFTGRDRVGNGLLYFRNRMYSPLLGRFISEDPLGWQAGPNFFAYCGNDPVNFSDPLGLSPGDGFMTGVAGLADGSVAAFSGVADPNVWMNMLQPGAPRLVPDAYNPGAMLRKWYKEYSSPTYGTYRCMEGYGVSKGLAEFGSGVLFSEIGGRAVSAIAPRLPKLKGDGCFVAGTLVTLGNGERVPIETVKVGDTLQARNVETGKTEARVVKSTSKVKANVLITIEVADATTGKVVDTITGTPNHPFFVGEKEGWVPMGELGIGTHLVTRAGPELVVKSSTREERLNGVYVYNFQVEGVHTYFVGTAQKGILVHNGTPDCTALALKNIRKLGDDSPVSVIRLKPRGGENVVYDPVTGKQWAFHDVLLKDGLIYDPMRKMNGVDFDTWYKSFAYPYVAEYATFEELYAANRKSFRSIIGNL